MVKKMIIKKIIIASLALFTLTLFCIFPSNSNKLDSIKQELEYVNEEVITHDIFLLDNNQYVSLTQIIVEKQETLELARELLDALIIDGKEESKIPSGFKSLIPSNTEIKSITYRDKTIKIDFNEFLFDTNKEMEEKILESIIFTMTSIKDVDNVLIYVNGKILTTLPQSGKILPPSFDRNYGINKNYNINNIKDITHVTTYYINEYNDNFYYVPVTSYINDDRDKISIIIEELSNNFTYMNDLMSFLKEDTKLISSKIEDDTMILEFNDAIFNSLDTKDILEEVIYTISLSIHDNYDVNNITFKVENEEIYKKSIE